MKNDWVQIEGHLRSCAAGPWQEGRLADQEGNYLVEWRFINDDPSIFRYDVFGWAIGEQGNYRADGWLGMGTDVVVIRHAKLNTKEG